MKVRNASGIPLYRCDCGTWLQHWTNYSRHPLPKYCAESNCLQQPKVGGLVQVDGSLDNRWWIVPLCPGHATLAGRTLELAPSTVLVPANIALTCAKRHVMVF